MSQPRTRDRRIRRRGDFDRVFQRGRHNGGRLLSLRSVPNDLKWSRFAFAIPKRVGNAVTRNRLRRRLREIIRHSRLQEGYDVVVSARGEAGSAGFADLQTELLTLMKRARLLEADQA